MAVSVLVLAPMTTGGAPAADCERACLKSMITKDVDAMVAHDPSRRLLSREDHGIETLVDRCETADWRSKRD